MPRCAGKGVTGCLIDLPIDLQSAKKIEKIFKLPLAKLKTGDILRTRCVLNAQDA